MSGPELIPLMLQRLEKLATAIRLNLEVESQIQAVPIQDATR